LVKFTKDHTTSLDKLMWVKLLKFLSKKL
jgi:hypothetical protein